MKTIPENLSPVRSPNGTESFYVGRCTFFPPGQCDLDGCHLCVNASEDHLEISNRFPDAVTRISHDFKMRTTTATAPENGQVVFTTCRGYTHLEIRRYNPSPSDNQI